MSEQEPQEAGGEEKAKGGLPVKTIAVVLVMLVVEAVGLLGAVMMFGKPSEVQAVGLEESEESAADRMVEIPIVREKFTNNSSGRVWVWDTEIVVVAKEKHAGPPPSKDGEEESGGHGGGKDGDESHGHGPTLRDDLLARQAQIRTGIGAIMSAAQHSYFTEPGRETLSRQILEYLQTVFGTDAEGEERVQGVLIPRCLGFPADY